ncbi:MAG: aminoglycoside 6'-N-acetyltransferase [Gemmatimonadales bacterium]
MDTGVRIRHARPDDARSWATLRNALWPDQPLQELLDEAEMFFSTGDGRLASVLVAEKAGEGLVGFAELSLRPYAEDCRTSPVAFLEGWYVTPSMRQQGVGRALVRAAEQWGRAQGCREFGSDTQFDNSTSIAAHLALGFEDAGALRSFRKDL